MRLRIAVIGQSGPLPPELATLAREVGAEIARRGALLLCGGRDGVMQAACAGAKAAGGITVGILPGSDDAEANPAVDIPLPTGLDPTFRSLVLVHAAHAVVSLGGGAGTLVEITAAYRYRKPLVLLAPAGGWAEQLAQLAVEGRYLDWRRLSPFYMAATAREAVERAAALARPGSAPKPVRPPEDGDHLPEEQGQG